MAVARAIRRLRLARGLSQEALADAAELDRTYISAVERGRRNMSIGTLDRIVCVLVTHPREFLKELERELDAAT